jgi:hypothetical protein
MMMMMMVNNKIANVNTFYYTTGFSSNLFLILLALSVKESFLHVREVDQ